MDLIKQEETLAKIGRLLKKQFKDKIFHVVISVETEYGKGTVLSTGSLTERSPYQAWKTVVTGLKNYSDDMEEKFNSTEDIKFVKPIEDK